MCGCYELQATGYQLIGMRVAIDKSNFARPHLMRDGNSQPIRREAYFASPLAMYEVRHISREEEIQVSGLYQELADMLAGFIEHLRRSDRKNRG